MTEHDYSTPSDSFVQSLDIRSLLPQREPFVMVGRLMHFDMCRTVTETVVAGDNILAEDGCLSTAGLLENVAQTCAARIGYINRFILHRDVAAGVVGSIRNMTIRRLPRIGSTITTTVEVTGEAFGCILVSARVECEGETLLSGEWGVKSS